MTDWLADIGALCLAASALKQIWEEWPTRGITDTSYSALLLLAVGSVALMLDDVLVEGNWPAALLPGLCLAIACALIWIKSRDFYCTKFRIAR